MVLDPSQVFNNTSSSVPSIASQGVGTGSVNVAPIGGVGSQNTTPSSGRLRDFFRTSQTPLSGSSNDQYNDAIHAISQGEHYLDPSFAAGTLALPHYMRTLSSLTRHPTELENQIMGSYTASPYATYQEQNLGKAAAQQAGQGGQIGTPDEQIALEREQQGIVSKDQQQYYNDAMKPFQMGLSGEQNLTNMGLQAGQGISGAQQDMANVGMKSQELQDARDALSDKEESSTFSSLLGAGGGLLGDLIMSGAFA